MIDLYDTALRTVEVNSNKPGALGSLVQKRVYRYQSSGSRCISNGSTDYIYYYDHIGNVLMVTYSSGYKAFFFSQDAYGNELSLAGTAYTGSAWSSARSAGN